ncbi:MAG: fumarylacetoacetate hydrolase family protein [Candidatus Tectomicrobia bacterium]|nr:fumarylacetoacetate hydrolase family protein [Candidatus Tectomicrobia bacterium]
MPSLNLCTFDQKGVPMPGLVGNERILPLAAAYATIPKAPPPPASLLDLMGDAPAHEPHLERLAAGLAQGRFELRSLSLPLATTRLLAPLLYPRKLFCAGANYYDHVKEMGSQPPDTRTEEPFFFLKPPTTTIIGPGAPIVMPKIASSIDWEIELAVVIGRRCRDLSRDEAMAAVAGYTILVDVSVRGEKHRRPRHTFTWDWLSGKGFDTAAPMGPWVVLKSSIADPQNLCLKLFVNDVLKQNSNTNQMIFSIVDQVTWLSRIITLEPGDVVSTGTPAGVGAPRKEFLKPGDVVRAEIEEIGTLTNPVVGPEA